MRNLSYLNKYRQKHPLTKSMGDDCNGLFVFKKDGNIYTIIASNGKKWDHVSVSLDKKRTLTWEEMCWVKDLFFEEHEVAIQIHPRKIEYVNRKTNCLHLWRYQGYFPTPSMDMV